MSDGIENATHNTFLKLTAIGAFDFRLLLGEPLLPSHTPARSGLCASFFNSSLFNEFVCKLSFFGMRGFKTRVKRAF
jgi:hypothetical protein